MSIIMTRRTHDNGENGSRSVAIEIRRVARRRREGLAVTGSIAAILLIVSGAPVAGLVLCIATLVPLIVEA